MVFVFLTSPNHKLIKYRYLLKNDNQITPAYLMVVTRCSGKRTLFETRTSRYSSILSNGAARFIMGYAHRNTHLRKQRECLGTDTAGRKGDPACPSPVHQSSRPSFCTTQHAPPPSCIVHLFGPPLRQHQPAIIYRSPKPAK